MPRAASDIRETFLHYFEKRGHQRVASAALVPDSDPTLMFVNAGMVPFKKVFLGEETRAYSRATTSQKVMRVSGKHNDLEEVGRSPRHHTFFEMLGNFSFGDYFKREAIEFAWELLTEGIGIEPERMAVSVFTEDDEAHELWRAGMGLPSEKIFRLGESENFWSMGDTGPCGPCSEIHMDFGAQPGCPSEICDPSCDCGRWLEIWNLVFMQYNRDAAGEQKPLPRPSIDTGAGLERLAWVVQGVESDYETDLFTPLLARGQELSGVSLGQDPEKDVSLKVVSDHARACTFLIGDGVLPSNEGRGYVLRRILRRASRHGVLLGLEEPFLHDVANVVIDEMAGAYPDLAERRAFITDRIRRDEERFLQTLSRGLSLLEEEIREVKQSGASVLPGETAFKLYDTFGFPLDLTMDILRGEGMTIDEASFDSSMQVQRNRARAAWKGSGDQSVDQIYGRIASDLECEFVGYQNLEGESAVAAILVDGASVDRASSGDVVELVFRETPFYGEAGGQVGDRGEIETDGARVEVEDTQKPVEGLIVHRGRVVEGDLSLDDAARLRVDSVARAATVRNHSGTHILHAALREVLGPQAMQKGSLVSPERLRFDFTHDAPLTRDEIERIEDLANEWIECNASAQTRVMSYPDAVKAGAIAIFEEKYGDEVRVVSFGEVSTELCGGTHASATGEIGVLKVVSETGIASGIRRIEAVTGMGAVRHMREQERTLQQTSDLLKSSPAELPDRVARLLEERRAAAKEIEEFKASKRGDAAGGLLSDAREVGGVKALAVRVDGTSAKDLRSLCDDLRAKLGSGIVLLTAETDAKVLLAVGVTKDLTGTHKAGDLIGAVAPIVGGKGGGRPDFAQAGGRDASKIGEAMEAFYARLEQGS